MGHLVRDITETSVIYVAICRHCNAYKIGTSNNLRTRVKQLKTANPYLTVLYVGRGSYLMEAHFHKLFSDKRIRGEWFNLSSEDIRILIEGF